MNFLVGSKLYNDSQLRTFNNNYKNCIADEIEKAFTNGTVVQGEVCVNEKAQYYTYLHSQKRVEHDNLVAFYKTYNDASFE